MSHKPRDADRLYCPPTSPRWFTRKHQARPSRRPPKYVWKTVPAEGRFKTKQIRVLNPDYQG